MFYGFLNIIETSILSTVGFGATKKYSYKMSSPFVTDQFKYIHQEKNVLLKRPATHF